MSKPETTPRTLTIQQLERINAASAMNQQRVADKLRDLAILATDANVAERRTALQCQGCSYLSRYRISGQAFTRWNCQICKLEQRGAPQYRSSDFLRTVREGIRTVRHVRR